MVTGNGRTKVVIVGGGLGGLACAQRLAMRNDRLDRIGIKLIDQKPQHEFLPALPWVVVGRRGRRDASRPLNLLQQSGIRFVETRVTGLDIGGGAVETRRGRIPYDELVLAPGAALAPESVPGLEEAAHGFYTLKQAERLAAALREFRGGRVLIVVATPSFRSLGAPYEAAFLIERFLRRRGVTSRVDVATAEPRPIPVADLEVSERVSSLLSRRGIGFAGDRELRGVDPGAREVEFADGREPFDLLIAVPPHRVPEFVASSPLAGADGWIPAAPFGLNAGPHVHAIGDVTEIALGGGRTLPKAGVVAQREGEVVADNIALVAGGVRPRHTFRGRLDYFLELGFGRALGVRGDLYRGRRDHPRRAFRARRPGFRGHRKKLRFVRRSLRELSPKDEYTLP